MVEKITKWNHDNLILVINLVVKDTALHGSRRSQEFSKCVFIFEIRDEVCEKFKLGLLVIKIRLCL